MANLPNECRTDTLDPLFADSELSDARTYTPIRFENDLDKNIYHVEKTIEAACLILSIKPKLLENKANKIKVT